MWNGNKKYLILLYGVEQKSLTIIRWRSFRVLLKNIYYFYFRHEGIGLERCLEIRISLRLLFTQGLNSHIRIVIKFNVLSKMIHTQKVLINWIIIDITLEFGANEIEFLTKQRKFGLNFPDFVFHRNVFGSSVILIVKILYLVNIILHVFCWFYLTFYLR